MPGIRVVVVDDEQLAREELCFLLGQAGNLEIVGQAKDGVEALRLSGELKPDVVFLDVQMPGLTGFEVARRLLVVDAPPQLVFVTAFDQYAVDAFSVNAVDYLLKPVDLVRLSQTLDRARRRLIRVVWVVGQIELLAASTIDDGRLRIDTSGEQSRPVFSVNGA